MNEVNKTLFIPLYGKAKVSRQNIILKDPTAEKIWDAEGFPIRGKSLSKWLAYNMAMRARVFDNWTDRQESEALVQNMDRLRPSGGYFCTKEILCGNGILSHAGIGRI